MDGKQNKIYKYQIKMDRVKSYIWIGIAETELTNSTTDYGPYESKGFGAISCHIYGSEFWSVKSSECKIIEPKFYISSGDVVGGIIACSISH